MCEMVRSIDNNIEFFESKFQNKTSQIEQKINNYMNSKMNMTEPYTNYSPVQQQLVPQYQKKKNTNLKKGDIKKQKIRNRINNLTKLLNRIKNKKFVELTKSSIPKDIDNPFIKNLLKIGNMSHDILSKSRDNPDNKERQMLEMWVKNRKTIKKQLQNDVSKKLAEHDRQRRIRLITLAQRKARTKRINNMKKNEKKRWDQNKLKREAEFGENALKNMDSQLQKINNNINDNQSALTKAKNLLNKFISATNVFEKLKKLEAKRFERHQKWVKRMKAKEAEMAWIAKKQRARLARKLKVMEANNKDERIRLQAQFKKEMNKKMADAMRLRENLLATQKAKMLVAQKKREAELQAKKQAELKVQVARNAAKRQKEIEKENKRKIKELQNMLGKDVKGSAAFKKFKTDKERMDHL